MQKSHIIKHYPYITYITKIPFGRVGQMPVYYQELLQTKPVYFSSDTNSFQCFVPIHNSKFWQKSVVELLSIALSRNVELYSAILRNTSGPGKHLGIGEGESERVRVR